MDGGAELIFHQLRRQRGAQNDEARVPVDVSGIGEGAIEENFDGGKPVEAIAVMDSGSETLEGLAGR